MEELDEEKMLKEEGGKMTMTCGIWNASGDWAVLQLPKDYVTVQLVRIWNNGRESTIRKNLAIRDSYTPVFWKDSYKILSYRIKPNGELAIKKATGTTLTGVKIAIIRNGKPTKEEFIHFV